MQVSIIAIGDELLIGQVVDTNSGMISREINPDGWSVRSVRVVADDADEIKRAIKQAFDETDVVLTTGGLGPTKDDITKPTLCELFGGELVYDKAVEANVLEVVRKRGLKINPLTAAQAYVPSSCRTFIVIGYSESVLAGMLDDYEKAMPGNVHLAYLPKPGLIRLRLTGTDTDASRLEAVMAEQSDKLASILGKSLICREDKTIAQILGDMLRDKGYTMATAESCTGGNIAHEITQVAGSSDYYKGSVVSYANEVKEGLLGVDDTALATEGAVSEPVVRQMSEGVSRALNTDCAVATSGIAGPGGGIADKPVGTVWISATKRGQTESKCYHFAGNRDRVINHATTMAQIMLIKMLIN